MYQVSADEDDLTGWQILWTTLLIVIVLFLALYDLEYFPSTWFDESIHLLVAKKLALALPLNIP
jgi:hypothetical protein